MLVFLKSSTEKRQNKIRNTSITFEDSRIYNTLWQVFITGCLFFSTIVL